VSAAFDSGYDQLQGARCCLFIASRSIDLGTGYQGIKIRGITPQSLGGTLRQIQLVHFHEIFGQTAKAECLVLVIDNLEDCDDLAVQA